MHTNKLAFPNSNQSINMCENYLPHCTYTVCGHKFTSILNKCDAAKASGKECKKILLRVGPSEGDVDEKCPLCLRREKEAEQKEKDNLKPKPASLLGAKGSGSTKGQEKENKQE